MSYEYQKRRHVFNNTLLSKKKRKNTSRSVRRYKLLVRDNDGSLREIRPEDTLWYLLYVNQPPLNERIHRLFRSRFKIPYETFLKLSVDITNHSCFKQWTRADAVGNKPVSIKLLLLGCLRFIGRA